MKIKQSIIRKMRENKNKRFKNKSELSGINCFFFVFFKFFLSGPRSFLWSHWLLLFWTSYVLPHGFQIQSGYLACTLSCLHAVILKVMSGVTPAFSTNRGVHCISMYMAWWPVTFPTCHICNRGRLPGFDRETSRTVSRRTLHSATEYQLLSIVGIFVFLTF